MKLHDALKQIFSQFGKSVLQEKRLMAMLSDFHSFEDCPALREVMKSVCNDGYAGELYTRSLHDDPKTFNVWAYSVKKKLAAGFRKELADYAIDSISCALGRRKTLTEPSYHGYEASEQKSAGDAPKPRKTDSAAAAGKPAKQNVSDDCRLGDRYYYGRGVPQDYAGALRCYLKAAADGSAAAANSIGRMYENGQGTAQDYAEALKWYRRAAEAGNALAQYNLGSLYRWAKGVSRDYEEALKWYKKAAVQGNAYAQNSLGGMYKAGIGVLKDYDEAIRWYRKAADQGNKYAEENLGKMYEYGQGVIKSLADAAEWYRKSAEQGCSEALKRLIAIDPETAKMIRQK